jgi:hypothetical protein
VLRLQELRGAYGIKAPAPICATDDGAAGAQADCQVVQAPEGGGSRLVADMTQQILRGGGRPPSLAPSTGASYGAPRPDGTAEGGEIRLTYRELSKLIEDAIKALR